MDTTEAAIEADVELDSEALQQEQRRRGESRGQLSAEVSKPGIDISRHRQHNEEEEEDTTDEESPLLSRNDEDDRRPSWGDADEFSHLPWYKRPSIFWVLGPFFLMTCAFGGIITPKINLILQLVCREYMSERVIWDPDFTPTPLTLMEGDNDVCRAPEVQSRVSMLFFWASILAGGFAMITSPKLGSLSDRYGRKTILLITSIGTIASEVITICAATYPDSFPSNLMLVGYSIDGLTGSYIVTMAIATAYAADCTPPSRRNVAFGYFHGTLFTGIAIGPFLAGYIVKVTGRLVVIFYIMMCTHIFFILFVGLLVPESLSKKRQLIAREKHKAAHQARGPNASLIKRMSSLNVLEPLKILWPTGPGSSPALRRNLFFLAAVDTIIFGVAMGSITVIITYTNYMFGWGPYESGRYMSIVNTSRVLCLLVVLPALTRLVRGRQAQREARKATGSDRFDLSVIRVAVLFDTLGYVGYSLARSGSVLTLSGCVAAIGGIGSPTLQSSLTKHVPADQTGQLLGATSLLHALARVVAPAIFSAIYAKTVKDFPQTVFVCLASTFGLAFLISWFLKTNVYFDEERAAAAAEDPDSVQQGENGEGERLPIVGAVTALFFAIGVKLGLASNHHH